MDVLLILGVVEHSKRRSHVSGQETVLKLQASHGKPMRSNPFSLSKLCQTLIQNCILIIQKLSPEQHFWTPFSRKDCKWGREEGSHNGMGAGKGQRRNSPNVSYINFTFYTETILATVLADANPGASIRPRHVHATLKLLSTVKSKWKLRWRRWFSAVLRHQSTTVSYYFIQFHFVWSCLSDAGCLTGSVSVGLP